MLVNFFEEVNILSIGVFIFLVILALLVSDLLKNKKDKTHEEILRKVPHILVGVIFSLSPIFMNRNEIIFGAIILFFGVWIGKYSPFFKSIFSIKRITFGMWMTPLSLTFLSWIWLPENLTPFLVGILILTFADSAASLIGRLVAKKKIPFLKKTFLGSFSFFVVSFLILWIFSKDFDFWNLIWISAVLTFAELILIFGLDNLVLPILASYLFYWFL